MTEKAHLKMHLQSDSYECEEEHDIDAGQWERIQRVLHGTEEAMTENAHNGLADELVEAAKELRDGGGPACMNDPITADLLDRAAAALRAREAQPAEQQEAVAYLVVSKTGLTSAYAKGQMSAEDTAEMHEHGYTITPLVPLAHPPSVAPREAQQAKPVAWKLVRADEVESPLDRAMIEQAYLLLPAGFAVAQLVAAPSEGAQRDAKDDLAGGWNCKEECNCKRPQDCIRLKNAALSRRPA